MKKEVINFDCALVDRKTIRESLQYFTDRKTDRKLGGFSYEVEVRRQVIERPFARPPPMPSKNSGGKVNGHGQWAGRGYRCPAKCPSPSSVSFCSR